MDGVSSVNGLEASQLVKRIGFGSARDEIYGSEPRNMQKHLLMY